MIKVTIDVDGAKFVHELADATPTRTIRRVIDERLAGVPSYFDGTARIVAVTIQYGHGPVRRWLEGVADVWLHVNPAVRYGLYVLAVALLVALALGW